MALTFEEIMAMLQTKAAFADIDAWEVKSIDSGIVSKHTYRLTSGETSYFVKEIKDNERIILQLLTSLELNLCPRVIYPDILEHHLLVAEYIPGGHFQNKKLDPELIKSFATMQNVLNNENVLKQHHVLSDRKFHDRDDDACQEGWSRLLDEGYEKLLRLRKYDLAVVEAFVEIADHLGAHRERILNEFCRMPFAWQHHDFKENNIVGSPQKLADWGSSYGHGPFLFDLAPFLFNDDQSLNLYIAHSDICKKDDRETIERWLYAATCARFIAFLQWRIDEDGGNVSARDDCKAFLEYEYETYKGLLTPSAVTGEA